MVYVKAPHSHLVEFGHVQVAKDGKTVLKQVPGKHFLRKGPATPFAGRLMRCFRK